MKTCLGARLTGLCLLTLPLMSLSQQPIMLSIPGGTRILGGGYQFEVRDWRIHYLGQDSAYASWQQGYPAIGEIPAENNPDRQVTVSDFYLSQTEVTVAQYRAFMVKSLLNADEQAVLRRDLRQNLKGKGPDLTTIWAPLKARAAAAGILPDTACWQSDFTFAYNEPLTRHYFWHPAFDQYPIVGVSWSQAHAYCEWLTETVNAARAEKGQTAQAAYRLPTEAEWEYAAYGQVPRQGEDLPRVIYPWPGTRIQNDRGRFMANIKTGNADYIGDNYEYTCPVWAFEPNGFGLYSMAGNVSEWVEDVFRLNTGVDEGLNPVRRQYESEMAPVTLPPFAADHIRVVKGGSWADFSFAARCGSRTYQAQERGSSRTGFRVAMSRLYPE